MNRIRFAIIGCGRIASRHIQAIQANPDAELVALCDLNEGRARERNEGVGVHLYRSYHDMLEKEDVDVVNLMTPNGMHAEHAMEIITQYKKHVVVEKPVCLRIEDGKELIRTAKHHRVQLFAVHQNRCNKAIQKVKSGIDEGLFGKISLATVRIRWSRGQSYYDRDPWRGTWALDGGALTNQAVHHIDLLRWLVGDVESVSAVAATQLVDVEVEDTACVWLRFKHGALGAIEATTATRPLNKDLEASISILGENGSVIVEGASVNKLSLWTFGDLDLEEFSEYPPNVYGYGHDTIIRNVVNTLRKKENPLITGEDALGTIALLNAIYRSIELHGSVVRLDEKPISRRFGDFGKRYQNIINLYRTGHVLKQQQLSIRS